MSVAGVLALQATAGNAAVTSLMTGFRAGLQRAAATAESTEVAYDPLPVSPPRARLRGTYSDEQVAAFFYGKPDVPITRLPDDEIEVLYSTLVETHKPAFRDAATPFEREGAERQEAWKPIEDPLRGGMVIGYARSSGGFTEVVNTAGDLMGQHEIGIEALRIPLIDDAIDLLGTALTQAGYALAGTADAWLEDNWRALGLPPHHEPFARLLGIPPGALAYRLGRGAGHLVALLQSAAEIVQGIGLIASGAGLFAAGVATTPEGVGLVVMPVGAVTVAAGSTILVHGGALAGATFMNAVSSGGAGGGGRDPVADKIANGHAYDKHVVKQKEFPEIKDKNGFADLIDKILKSPEKRSLAKGRTAYWDDTTKTVVITDPAHVDGGTCFRPVLGIGYYLGLK